MKKLLLFIILIFISSPMYSATIYMGAGETYTNLQAAMSAMSGGDTLIIKDGTYTGALNAITNAAFPPNGSSGAYTIIKAENDGGVLFDGENVRDMFYTAYAGGGTVNRYWQFEGIIWGRSLTTTVLTEYCSHIKFLRCGFYDAGNGNTANITLSRGDYFLIENCYAWGSGRTKISAYRSTHVIFRNCVVRMDRIETIGNNPAYAFGMYSVDYGLVQNCIVIDSDQDSYYDTHGGEYAGSFAVPSTNADSTYISHYNCISLNNHIGGFSSSSMGAASYKAYDVVYENCIQWDVQRNDNLGINTFRGIDTVINHCTFGVAANTYYGFNSYSDENNNTTFTNNIIYNYIGGNGGFYEVENEDYGAYYGNTNIYAYGTSQGAHTQLTTNPLTNSLKYLIKIENSSDLDGDASDSGDIGATVLHLVGTSGTLYGETGYNTTTAVKMWPFPNEALIREKMRAYTWDSGNGGDPEITGVRGFTASGVTLTSYILNYLEPTNEIGVTGTTDAVTVTADVDEFIYGESGEPPDIIDPVCAFDDATNPQTINGYSYTWTGTCSDANGISAVKIRLTSAPDGSNGTLCTGTTSWSCTITGLVAGNNDVHVAGDDGTNWGDVNKTVTAPPYRASAGGSYNIR